MSRELLKVIDEQNLRETPPEFEIGDTVDVHCMIHEGEKTRTQVFSGTVIARSGESSQEMFTAVSYTHLTLPTICSV